MIHFTHIYIRRLEVCITQSIQISHKGAIMINGQGIYRVLRPKESSLWRNTHKAGYSSYGDEIFASVRGIINLPIFRETYERESFKYNDEYESSKNL